MKIVIERTLPRALETSVGLSCVVLGQTVRRKIDPCLELRKATGALHVNRSHAIVGLGSGLVSAGHEVYFKWGKQGEEKLFVAHNCPAHYFYFGLLLGSDKWGDLALRLSRLPNKNRWAAYCTLANLCHEACDLYHLVSKVD